MFLQNGLYESEQTVSRVLFLSPDTPDQAVIINLGRQLPAASSDLPENSSGPLSIVLLCGLSPDGVYQASPVTRGTGELLPRLFTLTCRPQAVYFLWHFP
jgi:hypothetical protein